MSIYNYMYAHHDCVLHTRATGTTIHACLSVIALQMTAANGLQTRGVVAR